MIIAFYPGAGGNRYLRMLQGQEWQTHARTYDKSTNQFGGDRYVYSDLEYSAIDGVYLTHCVNTALIKQIWPNHSITVIKADLQHCLRREWTLHGHNRYHEQIDQNKVAEIELYNAIKDISWPPVENEQDILLLPQHIQQEFNDALRSHTTDSTIVLATDVCGILTKEYKERVESACPLIQWHKDYYESYPLDLYFSDTVIDIDDKDNEFSRHMKQELSLYQSEVFDRCWTMTYAR